MKYTKEERMDIGRRIYQGEMSQAVAAVKYDINLYTARDYMRLYKAREKLLSSGEYSEKSADGKAVLPFDTAQYENMTRQELLDELMIAKTKEEQARNNIEPAESGTAQSEDDMNQQESDTNQPEKGAV